MLPLFGPMKENYNRGKDLILMNRTNKINNGNLVIVLIEVVDLLAVSLIYSN